MFVVHTYSMLIILQSFGLSDVIGCYLDLDNWIIKWSKNGESCHKCYLLLMTLDQVVKNSECLINFANIVNI